jgi:hypothetical protein
MRHVQPIRDFDRHNPQSSLYVNSGFRPECANSGHSAAAWWMGQIES